METILRDIAYSWRSLSKAKGFTVIVVITLALGIGINTAMFSALDALLLRPLPFSDAARLVMIWEKDPRMSGMFSKRLPTSPHDFQEWKSRAESFEQMAFLAKATYNVTGGDTPERVEGAAVASNLFSLLGVSPAIGRDFNPEEGAAGHGNVVILSRRLFDQRFNSDRRILGSNITMDGESYTVIGVLPASVQLPAMAGGFDHIDAQVWVPLNPSAMEQRKLSDARFLVVMAKLKPGVTLEQARSEMSVIAKRLEQDRPEQNQGIGASVFSLHVEDVGEDSARIMLSLQVAVGFVLLIACANLANLMLARTARRQRDIALRLALGSSRLWIARQMLVESLILSLLGSTLGLAIAEGLMVAVNYFAPPDLLSQHQLRFGFWIFVFSVVTGLLTGVLFGTAPAFYAVRQNVNEVLKQTERSGGGRLDQTRGVLVVAEVSLAFVLLVGAGLLARSLLSVLSVDQGFNVEHLLTAQVSLAGPNYQVPENVHVFCNQLLDRLRALPGVSSASITSGLPLRAVHANTARLPGQTVKDAKTVDDQYVSEDYFQTMGSALRQGRQFTRAEAERDDNVAIVNQTLADLLWPDRSPLGQVMIVPRGSSQGSQQTKDTEVTVVGIVPDTHQLGPETPARPEIYFPSRRVSDIYIIMHTGGEPMSLANSLRKAVQAIDNTQPVYSIVPIQETFSEYLAKRRFSTWLTLGFAGFALLLATVGMYSVLAYLVSQRTREIGVRVALGAQSGDVIKMVLKQALAFTCWGLVIGLGASLALSRVLASFVFGVRAIDPVAFLITTGALFVVAFLAGSLPARQAAKVDPIVALRSE